MKKKSTKNTKASAVVHRYLITTTRTFELRPMPGTDGAYVERVELETPRVEEHIVYGTTPREAVLKAEAKGVRMLAGDTIQEVGHIEVNQKTGEKREIFTDAVGVLVKDH